MLSDRGLAPYTVGVGNVLILVLVDYALWQMTRIYGQ